MGSRLTCKRPPRGVSQVWQGQGLETRVFGSVAMLGLTGEFPDVWQGKDLGLRGEEIGIRHETESGDRRSNVATSMRKDSTN